MTIETQQPEQEAPEAPKDASVSVEELMAEVDKLRKTNERILSESKDYKTKFQSLRGEIDVKEKQELEKGEQWKELLEKERNEKFEYQEKIKGMKNKVLNKSLKFELAKAAFDAEDLELLATALPETMVQIDEDNLTISGIKEAVEHLRKEKPFLFKKQNNPTMVTGKPEAMLEKPLNINDLSREERLQLVLQKHRR